MGSSLDLVKICTLQHTRIDFQDQRSLCRSIDKGTSTRSRVHGRGWWRRSARWSMKCVKTVRSMQYSYTASFVFGLGIPSHVSLCIYCDSRRTHSNQRNTNTRQRKIAILLPQRRSWSDLHLPRTSLQKRIVALHFLPVTLVRPTLLSLKPLRATSACISK